MSCVGHYILQDFSTLNLQIARQPQTKTLEGRGGGPQADKHLPLSPCTGKFFYIATFGIDYYQSNLSTLRMDP
jgi:hypothetical protein